MRVFIAGATGALGRPLTKMLVSAGHEVYGSTRKADKRDLLAGLGARPVVTDALDAQSLAQAMTEASPEVVVHALTALPQRGPMRYSDLSATNRLREEGTRNLMAAARQAKVRRVVAESMIFSYGYGDLGTTKITEDQKPRESGNESLNAIVSGLRAQEQQVLGAASEGDIEGVVLRMGLFYGPGAGTEQIAVMLRRRMVPLPGGGKGIASWVHVEDAARAVQLAVEKSPAGETYNVVDDEPVAFGDFVRTIAEVSGAPKPASIPTFVVKVFAPYPVVVATTNIPVDNAKTKQQLGWNLSYPTYREGLAATLRGPGGK